MMKGRFNLLYLAVVVVVAMVFLGGPAPGWALVYKEYVATVTDGSLSQPAKVAASNLSSGSKTSVQYYVSDSGHKKVKVFSNTEAYLSEFAVAGTPVGIAANSANVFVGDDTNDCVWIYDLAGTLANLGGTTGNKLCNSAGTPLTNIKMPNTITIAPSGHIFVVDGDNDKVLIFNSDGRQNGSYPSFGVSDSANSSGTTINTYFPSGLAMADSSSSAGIATQNFYLGDQGNYRVQKLEYQYDEATNAITTPPTFKQNVGLTPGTRGDSFGKFIRISDIVWDSNFSRLIVIDSMQMVGQIFDSSGNTINEAFNYDAGVLCGGICGHLNVPTGAVADTLNGRLVVANNLGGTLEVFSIQEGEPPVISSVGPSSPVVPCTATYAIDFSGTDTDSATVSVDLYYFDTAVGQGVSDTLFSSQTGVPVTAESFSGSAQLDLVGTFPNYMWTGTYGIYIVVKDSNGNTVSATAAGTVGITAVDGAYTCSMEALWGATTADFDLDGAANGAEINGTLNVSYGSAMTDPSDADTDDDGLDDGVEMAQKNVETNIPITLSGAYTVNTNPNSKDTDNGGTSDCVEIVKATSPTGGSDDLVVASSPQDVAFDYFMDNDQSAEKQDASFTFRNIGTSTAVVDFVFYNMNGTVNKTVPAAYVLAADQCVYFRPYVAYGVTEGSLEVRSTTTRIVGDIHRYNHNNVRPEILDMGGGGNIWLPENQGTQLYAVIFADTDTPGYRFRGYINIKNWSDSTVNATINFYRNIDGSVTPIPIVLAGHETTNLRPRDLVPTDWTGGCIEVVADAPITASQYITRYNEQDNSIYDLSFVYPFDNSYSTTSYGPMWSDAPIEGYRFIGYLYIYNPNETPINTTITLYDSNGNVAATKDFNNIQPHMKVGMRPSNNGVPSNITGGTFSVTSTGGPHISSIYINRYNAVVGQTLLDYGYYVPSYQDTGVTEQYIGNYRDFPLTQSVDRFNAYYYIWNPDPVNTVNLTSTYYDMNGNFVKSVSRPVAPRQRLGIRPSKGTDQAATEGSITVTSADYPFLGFMMLETWCVDSTSLMDHAFAKKYWR